MTIPSDATVAAIEAGFLDRGEIRGPDSLGDYDPTTGEHPTIPGDVFATDVPCQVSEAGHAGSDLTRGGEAELEHPYQVSIPRTLAPSPGLIFRVTAVHIDGDQALVGLPFIIRRVRYGTRSARRVLLCDLLQAVTDAG